MDPEFERARLKGKAKVAETLDTGPSEATAGPPQGDLLDVIHDDPWARNFREGLNRMTVDSSSANRINHPRAVYLREANSKGRRAIHDQELYPPTDTWNRLFQLSISDYPKVPTELEIEETFREVWYQAKLAVEVLCRFMVGNRHNLFDKNAFVDRVRPETFFVEPHHKDYVIIAALYEVFLRDFEKESFRSSSEFEPMQQQEAGWQSFDFRLTPDVRAVRSYQYFKSGSMSTDVDYIKWFRAKVMKFCEKFNINMVRVGSFASSSDGATIIYGLGGPYLLSYFTDVAVACWNLQTLAFSFKDPVVRVHIEDGEEFEDSRMVPVVELDKEELELGTQEGGELVVSFLVSPGFRFSSGNRIRAEVYVIGLEKDPSF
ncbi:hypothetical protein R1flu_001985 [Riccia fluitans]|uniref:Uncharacterized protein n=1 Tax=Riccia fluitans TaxID=41844 RepID=A0ABD1Y4U5_9MARC